MIRDDIEARAEAVAASEQPPRDAKEIVIRPVRAFSWEDVVDVWRYRELLWTLGLRDVRVRYKQAGLGAAWAIVQPLTQMIVFTVLFNRIAGIPTGMNVPYPVFVFSGLLVWLLFANGLSQASDSLVQSSDLVTKVYFPRVIMPLAAIVTSGVDFLVSAGLLVILMAGFGVPFQATSLLAIPIAILPAVAAASIAMWTSAINVRYRDVRYALPFFFQILVYLTPVFYPSSLVPERYRFVLDLNPMAAVVDSFRAALFGTPFPAGRLAWAVALILVIGVTGFAFFRRMERTFADRV